jgi:hypothetical protein
MTEYGMQVLKEMASGKPLTHSKADGWWVGFKKMPLGSACRSLIAEGYLAENPASDAEEYVLTDKGREQLVT